MAGLVWPRDTSPLSCFHQGLSGASETTEQVQGRGGCQMHHHHNPHALKVHEKESVCWMENQREIGFPILPSK